MNNSIEIVIVLYQCSLDESITFLSLKEQLKKTSVNYELIIYNNDINRKIEHPDFVVVNSEVNTKLEGAYNFALDMALEHMRGWILLLDQDTMIPDDYFSKIERLFDGIVSSDLVAIVPKLMLGGKPISPVHVTSFMRFEKALNSTGYAYERINALNSMSLINVQFIKSIGGFSKEFPFDMHDHWFYNQVHKHHKSVYVLDVATEHNSSFIDFENNVPVKRYKEFIATEGRFIRNELGIKVYLFYKIKILIRGLRQMFKYKDKKYAYVTFLSLLSNNKIKNR